MRIKVIQKCFAGTGENLMAGEEYEVMDRIGQKLIDRGYAEPADKPKRVSFASATALSNPS